MAFSRWSSHPTNALLFYHDEVLCQPAHRVRGPGAVVFRENLAFSEHARRGTAGACRPSKLVSDWRMRGDNLVVKLVSDRPSS